MMSDQENQQRPSSSRPTPCSQDDRVTPVQFRGRANNLSEARGGAPPKRPITRPNIRPQLSLEGREKETAGTLDDLVLRAEEVVETSAFEDMNRGQVCELIRELKLAKQALHEDAEECEIRLMILKRDNDFLHKEVAKQRKNLRRLREARSADDQKARAPSSGAPESRHSVPATPQSRHKSDDRKIRKRLFASPAATSSDH
ncbi:hypothetical protein MTO96_041284 [Rhipicephalus appendiculatus]